MRNSAIEAVLGDHPDVFEACVSQSIHAALSLELPYVQHNSLYSHPKGAKLML